MPALEEILSRPSVHSPRRLHTVGLAFALALAATFADSSLAFAWAPDSFSPGDEALLVTLTNQDRASAGLPALADDSFLHKEAEWRAKDMGDRDYFSHAIPPSSTMVFDDMQKDRYCFRVAGENIGLSTYGDDAATTRIEQAFMSSPTHRANILGIWSRIGVGAYKAANGEKLYAVLFSIPCAARSRTTTKSVAPSKATPKPTPSPTALPSPAPTATPGPAATPTAATTTENGADSTDAALPDGTTLKVREKAPPASPLVSLFRLLFGGWFG